MEPDPYIQFLENWIPGIGEDTKLHDQLHIHFGLGFSVNDEAKLLGFQLGPGCGTARNAWIRRLPGQES